MAKLSSLEDVKKYLAECEEYERKVSLQLEKINNGSLSPKVKREKRKQIKESLKHVWNNIDYVLDLVTKYSTFDAELILPFIEELINYSEYGDFVIAGKFADRKLHNDGFRFRRINHNIITTSKNASLLVVDKKPSMFTECDRIAKMLESFDDKRYIALEDEATYNLLDGMEVDERFKKFPILENAGLILVDLKLKYPKMSDEDRIAAVRKAINLEKRPTTKYFGLR